VNGIGINSRDAVSRTRHLAITDKETKKMLSFMQKFWQDESGQDLIEYTLLMAFVALASASIFISAGNSVQGIWGNASTQLVNANAGAS
jgi:Flp pilus assembly pilin Flp